MADMKSQGLHVNFKFHITLKEIKLVMSQGYFGCAITWPPKFWAQEADFKRLKKEFFCVPFTNKNVIKSVGRKS